MATTGQYGNTQEKPLFGLPGAWQLGSMLSVGDKITVYDLANAELGEGTFMRKSYLPDLKMTAYECKEHTILAKGVHFLKIGTGPKLKVPSSSSEF